MRQREHPFTRLAEVGNLRLRANFSLVACFCFGFWTLPGPQLSSTLFAPAPHPTAEGCIGSPPGTRAMTWRRGGLRGLSRHGITRRPTFRTVRNSPHAHGAPPVQPHPRRQRTGSSSRRLRSASQIVQNRFPSLEGQVLQFNAVSARLVRLQVLRATLGPPLRENELKQRFPYLLVRFRSLRVSGHVFVMSV